MVNRTFNRLMLCLVLLTLLALYAHAHWMTHVVRLDQKTWTAISAADDRSEGGKSIGELAANSRGLHLQCTIAPGYAWPFCEIEITLTPNGIGINLNDYEKIRFFMHSKGPSGAHPVRIFLRNFNPAYSDPKLPASLKPHEVVFNPGDISKSFSFDLKQFMVASWWMQGRDLAIEQLGPELDHVVAMSFATGGNPTVGQHEIFVDSIELIGPWVSPASFRLSIIFVWLAAILIYLIWGWRHSRKELLQSDRLREQLRIAKEDLEKRVEERTSELAKSNYRLIESLENLEGTRNELVQNEKNAALGALVAGVAHELNTPLGNAVLVSSAFMEMIDKLETQSREKLTRKILSDFIAEAKQGATILQQNLARTAALINNFKQLSVDQNSEQKRLFDLSYVLQETVSAMSPRLKTSGHDLELCLEPSLKMDSYPGPLSQVLINFINNAMIHAFEHIEHGKMTLRTRSHDQEQVEIIFSDNGCGIPAAAMNRVFEPFFTTKLGKGGSGLGMHLVQTMVTKMLGGKIDIHSVPNQGTSIHLLLPRNAPSLDENLALVGVPKDVLDDYREFLGENDILDIAHFDSPQCRRDVLELALFVRCFKQALPTLTLELVIVDSYASSIQQLRTGAICAIATTAWESDLLLYPEEVIASEPLLRDGESLVGAFTHPGNQQALSCQSREALCELRFASNSDWSADWNTLHAIGIQTCIDVKTWRQMVYIVSCKEADALLAPFPRNDTMSIEFDSCVLTAIPNLRIALQGSRHYACAKTRLGKLIASEVFPRLQKLVEDGSVAQAMRECGFFNEKTASWDTVYADSVSNELEP